MRYLLDTNTVIDMLKSRRDIQRQVIEHGPENCYISEMTIAELMTGYYLTGNPDELRDIEFIKENFSIIHITSSVLDCFSKSRAILRKAGKTIPAIDLLIISSALANNMTAVSHDEHFKMHPNLLLQDWAAGPAD